MLSTVRCKQVGTTLIEVLVTMIVLAFGLLGLAGLQLKTQAAEFESYQRSQALLLVNDMAQRINLNRPFAPSYVLGTSTTGAGMTCPTDTATLLARDMNEWCLALQGAAESLAGGQVGAMIGGRGCIQAISTNEYLVTVVWQGITALAPPPVSVPCGAGLYDSGGPCVADRCRRHVTTMVRIGSLL
jgi:type IV pilus assembly protein PilV